jgi:Ca-activated chloride channel family protein
MERQEAKVISEKTKAIDQTAAVPAEERPNLFTNSVANIGALETVIVQIECQETVRQSAGIFSWRLPLVVAHYYNSAPIFQPVDFSNNGYAKELAHAKRITPPVLDPELSEPTTPTTISVTLNAGFDTSEVKSL